MRQKRGIGMFKDPDTLVLKGFFCKSGHCTLIVEVKAGRIKNKTNFPIGIAHSSTWFFQKLGFYYYLQA